MSNFDPWLRDLKAAQKGGERFTQLMIERGRVWSKQLAFAADYSADAFECNIALEPDGTTLVSASVAVGSYSGGQTIVTVSLTAVQTASLSLIPADGDYDGVQDLAIDVLRTPSGGAKARLFAGIVPVSGKV